MGIYQVSKRLGGYPCSHRQWRDEGHCSYLHGYDRFIELTWQGERDHRGWVVDFGGLKELKQDFENQFDHTTLIAHDDPHMSTWRQLHEAGAIDMRMMDPTIEGMCEWVSVVVDSFTKTYFPNAELIKVTCFENEKNSATWLKA